MLKSSSRRFVRFAPRVLLAGVVLSVGLCADLARADELCVLKLKDGRTITGILVSRNDGGVTLRPDGGVNIVFSSSEIADVQVQKSPREEYAQKRAALKDSDMSGRYQLLLRFYYANQKSESAKAFAKTEVAQLAADFPDSAQIKTLSRVMNQADEAAPDDKSAAPETGGKKTPETAVNHGTPGLLSKEAQNLLRVYQLDFLVDSHGRVTGRDTKAYVVIPKEAVAELFKANAAADELKEFRVRDGEALFRRLPPLQQVGFFFALRARELYPKLEVRTEPYSLQVFRSRIHRLVAPALTRSLASQVPGLIASPRSPGSEAEAYTNFLALSLASVEGHPVIDRDTPENSLLLQWGLPREVAKYPAPEIKGWQPLFRNVEDRRFVEISHWIKTIPYQVTADNLPLPAGGGDGKPTIKPGT